MAFIKNNQYKEIYQSSKNGNVSASEILQALRNNSAQEEIDKMVNAYYNPQQGFDVSQPNYQDKEKNSLNEQLDGLNEALTNNEEVNVQESISNDVVDVGGYEPSSMEMLGKDFDDLVDENEIDDTSFADFLKNKRRDGVRGKKNSDYFKVYSPEDREQFMSKKIGDYKNKFNNRISDINRRYKDMDGAINLYIENINQALNDDKELDMDLAGKTYDEITSENMMHSLGRSWDNDDMQSVITRLRELVDEYGKQNVIAALNTLKNDNNNYKDYLNNQIDSEIGRYSKSIENLLK